MNAILQLTDREIARVRKDVFMERRLSSSFTLEALGECDDSWHKAHLFADSLQLHRAIDKAVWDYCEKLDYFGEAERELLAAIERDGGRRLA